MFTYIQAKGYIIIFICKLWGAFQAIFNPLTHSSKSVYIMDPFFEY